MCVCIPSCSVDKKIAHCYFSTDKMKMKKKALLGRAAGNILIFLFGLKENFQINFMKVVY